jgi:uncharacterized protein
MVTQTSARPGHADAGPVAPAARERLTLRPIGQGGVRIDDGFWGRYQALNRHTTIPHGMRMLEESGGLENLRIAAGISGGEYSMPLFRDSDVYKVLEAIAWERSHGADDAQERFFTDVVWLLRQAQQPDGYLNSYVTVVESGKRWTNPAMGHELYCAGHLLQAAVADIRTGGDADGLAAIAGRYASLLAGQLPGPLAGYVPGHPEIEMALVEFSRATGKHELVDLAADLVARRGHATLRWHSFGPPYFQDDMPFEQADTIRGHAVRALYLLSGATDVYTETGRPGLLRAALAQWDDMVSGKTYLTGGVGSRHEDEAFGEPFELPPDHAYCETCAAIASIMWNWRLLLATGEARFADLIERTLYNGFLAALGFDGASFYYVNALQSRAPAGRRPWYQCACCPPNIMRLLASLGHYIATSTEAGLQIHQFVTGRVSAETAPGSKIELQMTTGYPHDGALRLRVLAARGGVTELAVRVPAWAATVSATLNRRPAGSEPGSDHYLRIRRLWVPGDELTVELPLRVRTVRPDPGIDAVRSCVAFERGPLVYCFEGADVPGANSVAGISLPAGAKPAERPGFDVAGKSVIALSVPGQADPAHRHGWPYHPAPPTAGSPTGAGPGQAGPAPHGPGHADGPLAPLDLTAIPYYARANRGDTDMRVWTPQIG